MTRTYSMLPIDEYSQKRTRELQWLVFENGRVIAAFPSENRAAAYMRRMREIERELMRA